MSRLKASLIWYRARSGGELTARVKELMTALGAEIISEKTTINPGQVPSLLMRALKNSDISVIIGGLDMLRKEENTVSILSRCLAVKLEEGEKSRSKYIYDSLRGMPLPTFETAVLFPSVWGGPEGMSITAGLKTIILLPWMERQHMDIITMMQEHLPDIIAGIYGKEEEEKPPVKEPEPDDGLPDYIKRAVEKHKAAAIVPDEDFDTAQLRLRLSQRQGEDAPTETNFASQSQSYAPEPRPVPRQSVTNPGNPWEVSYPNPYEPLKPKLKPVKNTSPRRNKVSGAGALSIFRIAAVTVLLAVIFISCYVASSNYETELTDAPEVYQSDLAALFSEKGDNSILPDYALDEFASLYAVNPNTRGYIYSPGTEFAQPIVQPEVGNNDMYSYIDFHNTSDSRGTLYFDAANDISFGVQNSNLVVYGNSPSDGSMFAELQKYTNADYLSEHQLICMDTLYEQAQWVVFSVCIVSGNTISEFNYANTVFSGEEAHQQHLYNLYIRSLFCTEIEVFPTDQLLTLVTDSSEFTGAKLLVCARKVRSDEEVAGISHNVTQNALVLMPDIWYQLHTDVQSPAVPAYEMETTARRETITAPNYTDENGNPIYVTQFIATQATSATGATAPPQAKKASDMRITTAGNVITASAAETLAMIAEAEMGSDASLEALKAQCVAAYTYYLYNGGSAKAPSFTTKTAGARALEAADAVVGQYMTYNTNVPYTPYYEISAGKTAANADINGSKLAYLPSVDCSIDEAAPGYETVLRVSSAEVAKKVFDKKGIDLTLTPDKSLWFQILERDANDLYVTKVSVGGETVRGNTLYMSILGSTCLRSPCFWISYDSASDEFVFTSDGSGSGVGMSQYGANAYAQQGYDYIWILQHFYPGVGFATK